MLSSIVLVLSSEKVIPKLEMEFQLAFRFSGEPVVIYLSYCHIPTIEKLIESREIIGGKRVHLPFNSHLLGLFSYEQRHELHGLPTPYTRNQQPEQPLKLEELPEDIQDLISWTWFEELRFQDTEMIQPIEYTECDTWGVLAERDDRWVDTKGKIHEHLPDK